MGEPYLQVPRRARRLEGVPPGVGQGREEWAAGPNLGAGGWGRVGMLWGATGAGRDGWKVLGELLAGGGGAPQDDARSAPAGAGGGGGGRRRLVIPSRPILWDPIDCSPPVSSVYEIFQAGILE